MQYVTYFIQKNVFQGTLVFPHSVSLVDPYQDDGLYQEFNHCDQKGKLILVGLNIKIQWCEHSLMSN